MEGQRATLQHHVVNEISSMLMMSEEDVRPDQSVTDLGFESLVAVELRDWIARELEANMPVMEVVRCPSLQHLLDLVAARSALL